MISLRTAERYMELAREHDAESKIDRLSLLNSGSDAGAKDVKNTTERARGEVKSKVSRDKPKTTSAAYNLPLPLSSDEGKAVDELRTTPAWPAAQESIILVLRRFCANHGIEIGMHKEEA